MWPVKVAAIILQAQSKVCFEAIFEAIFSSKNPKSLQFPTLV
jgi:hypothetical protein